MSALGVFSTSEGYLECVVGYLDTSGGYHKCIGG